MKPFIYFVLAIVFYSNLLAAQIGGKWAWLAGDSCSSPSNSFVVTETKTNETNINSFDIRPCPNNGQFEIYLSSSYIGTVNLFIYDKKGDEVLKRNIEKNKQVLSELILFYQTPGIYMIRMVMKNRTVEKKFLIK